MASMPSLLRTKYVNDYKITVADLLIDIFGIKVAELTSQAFQGALDLVFKKVMKIILTAAVVHPT